MNTTVETLTPPTRENILAIINAELAPSTRTAYATAWNGFITYSPSPLPTDPAMFGETVLSYLTHLHEQGRTLSTIVKTLSAIKYHAGRENPLLSATLTAPVVSRFMEGLTRLTRDHTPRKARHFTVPELRTLYTHLTTNYTVRNARDLALIATGIAGALRSDNIALLKANDVAPALTFTGVVLNIRHSKTDQTGQGARIPIKSHTDQLLNPVGHINRWISVLNAHGHTADPTCPLFPTIRGNRTIYPTPIANPPLTITQILRTHAVASGIATEEEAKQFSSHTLRSTFITLSAQKSVREASIAAISGHKSTAALRSYDRSGVEIHAQTDYLTE